MIEELKKLVREYLPNANFKLIDKAYNYALSAHYCQKRANGAPYISHCINTAKILTERAIQYNIKGYGSRFG